MGTEERKTNRSRQTRQVFRDALGSAEPDLGQIREAFPAIVAEAARIRASEARVDLVTSIGLLAGRLVPRLATVAALLVLAGAAIGVRDVTQTQTAGNEVETLIITGQLGDSTSDLLLEAVTEGGTNNG